MSILSAKYASVALIFASALSVLVATGCGGDDPEAVSLGSCPTGSTAAQTLGGDLVKSKCVSCHSSMLTGTARGGAPPGVDYDVAATLKSTAAEMYSRAYDGSMPVGSTLTDAEIENIRVYLACLP